MNLFDRSGLLGDWFKTAVSSLRRQHRCEQRASTLVVTSLNPATKLNLQLNCFNKWQEIGYDIRSYNSRQEHELLLNSGIDVKRLQQIEEDQTALQLFDKQVPRILPVLESALRTDYDFYILTNSDIYPAHGSVVSSHFADFSESIAFTRGECPDLSINSFTPQEYYRGGLDVFWFTRQRLQSVLVMLEQAPVSERMAFGVPGWDFFLAHLICKDLDSPIIDGSIFLHQSHKNTYSNFDEFEFYSSEMKKSGHYSSEDFVALAHEFHLFIEQQCIANEKLAKTLEQTFYREPVMRDDLSRPV